ncbi:MAG TPA: sugar transferase [Anaerolineales bacterium]|nr:sugar transferase [Anaerolineales bacterium]
MHTTSPGISSIADSSLTQKIHQASRTIPRHWQWRLFTIALILNDVLITGAAFRLSYFLRFERPLFFFQLESYTSFMFYRSLVFVLLPLWLIIFAAMGLYNRQNMLGGTREYSLVFNATTIGMFLVIAAGFLLPGFIFARGWLLMAWGFTFVFTALGRFIIRRLIYHLREHGYFLSPAIIVGANDEGLSLAEQLLSWRSSGIHILGFIDKKVRVGTVLLHHLTCLGTSEDLDSVVNKYGIEEIILASSAISSRDKQMEIFKRYGVSSEVNVRMSSGLYEIITTGLTVKDFAYVPLVGVNPVRMTGSDQVMKLALDYTLTILGMIVLAPLLSIIGLIIKLDSPGPVFHRRRVMGVNGRQFDAFKFRTMHVNGDQILAKYPELQSELAETHKLKYDPRITRVGKWLRRFSLDELPQLINVLKLDMSLVGPRMIAPLEIDMYDKWDINLLTVKPGLTGLWQVSGRSDVSYNERVRLDMHYIRNWSIWLDLQIMLQTLPAVLRGKGAY